MTARFFVLVGVDDPDRMHNALDLAATRERKVKGPNSTAERSTGP
jgi:hypothetical protein